MITPQVATGAPMHMGLHKDTGARTTPGACQAMIAKAWLMERPTV